MGVKGVMGGGVMGGDGGDGSRPKKLIFLKFLVSVLVPEPSMLMATQKKGHLLFPGIEVAGVWGCAPPPWAHCRLARLSQLGSRHGKETYIIPVIAVAVGSRGGHPPPNTLSAGYTHD
jgi:hypothetical protein